jgi:hypothetical protein
MDQLREKKGQLTILLTPRKSAKIAEGSPMSNPFLKNPAASAKRTQGRKKKERKKKKGVGRAIRCTCHGCTLHFQLLFKKLLKCGARRLVPTF